MKVLMLGWELPPHNSGGLGVACYQLCKELATQGIDIQFILPYTAKHENVDFMRVIAAHPQDVVEVIQAGNAYDSYAYTHVHRSGVEATYDLFGQQAMFENQVDQLVDRYEFDIIHAHDWLTFRAALRAKQRSGKPLVVHIHATEHDRSGGERGNELVREIEYLAMTMADRVVAVSEATKQILVDQYEIPADKIEVVYNSIDIDTPVTDESHTSLPYVERMKELGYGVVVNVGRLTLQKNLTALLQAASKVVAARPKSLFLIAGAGEQERELLELSAELGIAKNVIFTGFLRGKQWRDSFRMGDLFVMPSVSEPFGLTPLEAIGYGTPALVSKQSGVAEVVNNMLKVDFWDVDELANQIFNVLEHPSLQHQLFSNSSSEQARLSWEESAGKLINIYQDHVDRLPSKVAV